MEGAFDNVDLDPTWETKEKTMINDIKIVKVDLFLANFSSFKIL